MCVCVSVCVSVIASTGMCRLLLLQESEELKLGVCVHVRMASLRALVACTPFSLSTGLAG